MFDFVVFFLMLLPAMDLIRNSKGVTFQNRLLMQFSAFVLVAAYFGKQGFYTGK